MALWILCIHLTYCFSHTRKVLFQKSPYNKPKAPNVYITAGTYNQWRNCPTSCMSKHLPSFSLYLYVMGLREHVATQTAILPTCSSAARFLMQSPALLNWTMRMRCPVPGPRYQRVLTTARAVTPPCHPARTGRWAREGVGRGTLTPLALSSPKILPPPPRQPVYIQQMVLKVGCGLAGTVLLGRVYHSALLHHRWGNSDCYVTRLKIHCLA